MANFKLQSTSYEWVVIAGARTQYKGVGAINGAGSYRLQPCWPNRATP